ncbi:MAG: sulfatase-like hydrolase/transferase [Blastocatellia bacterium]|nr:sulfatase-like hydrolase/transferase [Blastocatellia bacterium]
MMKSKSARLLFCLLLCLGAGIAPASARRGGVDARTPNIVLIISDDHGWRDYGFMGHPQIRTPRLDKLAAQSLVFPRGYVPTALCSPSLASMITGRYPHEHLITGNDPPAPPGGKQGDWRNHPQYVAAWEEMRASIRRHPLLPALLRQKGYQSLQTGKWWMGNYAAAGFTEGMSHGDKARGGRHGDDGLEIGRKTMQPIDDFIGKASRRQTPFLLWYAPMLPHSPHNPPQRLIDNYLAKAPDRETARYWASVEWFDETCGHLLDTLDRAGVADNTLVVYVTDNGWVQGAKGDAQSVRSKRTPYEAGIRTPIMVRWPGKVAPRRSEHLASSLDILPTTLAAAGIAAPPGLPGLNLLDDKAVRARRTLYGALFTHDAIDIRRPAANLMTRWVIDGEWKLLVPAPGQPNEEQPPQIELYRIAADPDERADLAAREPKRVAALRRKLDAWWDPLRR